jgi:nucleoid-associated protein YgaU
MTGNPSRLVAFFALLLGVWVVTYWLWEPRQDVAAVRISFDARRPGDAVPMPSAAVITAEAAPVASRESTASPKANALAPSLTDPSRTPARVVDRTPTTVVVPPRFFDYVVQPGDRSFEVIARGLRSRVPGLSAAAISAANPFVSPKRLVVGRTVLRIPEDPANIQGRVVSIAPVGEATTPGEAPTATTQRTVNEARDVTYTVGQGETLSDVARKTLGRAALWRTLYEANRDVIADPDRVRAGTVLRIPQIPSASGEPAKRQP